VKYYMIFILQKISKHIFGNPERECRLPFSDKTLVAAYAFARDPRKFHALGLARREILVHVAIVCPEELLVAVY